MIKMNDRLRGIHIRVFDQRQWNIPSTNFIYGFNGLIIDVLHPFFTLPKYSTKYTAVK